ncbi:hypothetical protein Csa_022949 [Cucumis sativus]|nr:hypothetical protein Csa_022949 [Cucumis sativus]
MKKEEGRIKNEEEKILLCLIVLSRVRWPRLSSSLSLFYTNFQICSVAKISTSDLFQLCCVLHGLMFSQPDFLTLLGPRWVFGDVRVLSCIFKKIKTINLTSSL